MSQIPFPRARKRNGPMLHRIVSLLDSNISLSISFTRLSSLVSPYRMETCQLLSGYLDTLAAKYPSTKFVSIVGDKVSKTFSFLSLRLLPTSPSFSGSHKRLLL